MTDAAFIDPSLPIQAAIVAALKASDAVKQAMGGEVRVHDRIPEKAVYPFIHVGAGDALDDGNSCHGGADTTAPVDIWSDQVGKVEAKRIAAAAALALDVDLVIEGHSVIVHEIESVRHLDGGDGLSSHSVVTPRYLTQPTD